MASTKTYSSQGVQTDNVPVLSESTSTQTGDDLACDTAGPSAGIVDANSSAYSYSNVPARDFLADAGHETREIRRQKYIQLPCNRPPQISNSNERRIASLPETVPPVKASIGITRRVVSASSARQSSRSHALDHNREYSQISTSTFAELEDDASGFGGSPCGKLDLPRTPSPPSSPESVTIISNPDFQVPPTFLRARQGQETYALQHAQDEDGWVTWANSPPRPIPALHGPLSLPYARCPSGAEGTVIEKGTEIPRMIWGLDTEGAHYRGTEHMPEKNAPIVHPPTEQAVGTNLRSVRSVTRLQEANPSFGHERANSLHGLGLSMPDTRSRPLQSTITKDDSRRSHSQSFYTPEANITRRPPTMQLIPEGLPLLAARGLQWDRNDRPAAAYLQHVRANSGARESEKAWDNQAALRTPVSVSPNWTPLFSSYLEMFGSPDVSVFDPTCGTPRLGFEPLRQSPASQPLPSVVDELSEELRRFVLQSITNPRASDNQMDESHSIALSDYYKQAFEHKHGPPLRKPAGSTDTIDLSYGPGMNHAGMSPIQPRPPPNSPMPPLRNLHSNNGSRGNLLSSPNQVYQSPGAMEVKSASNPRHLRSVPFARLMQRRLSVVQEEEPTPPALGKVHLHPAFSTPDDLFDIPESPRPSQTTWRSQPPNNNLRSQPLGPWTRVNSDASIPLVKDAHSNPSNEKSHAINKKRRRPKAQRG